MFERHSAPVVIFDFDGTLVDSAPGILAGLAATLERHGLVPCRTLDSTLIGPPLRDTLRQVSGRNDHGSIEMLVSTFLEYYDTAGYLDTVSYPGVEEMLQTLRNLGIDLYIATNKRLRPTRMILDHFGWNDFFNDVLSLDIHSPPLANKGALLGYLLKKTSLDPLQTVYVGDTLADELAATENRIRFLRAAWGYGTWTSLDEGPCYEHPSLLLSAIFEEGHPRT